MRVLLSFRSRPYLGKAMASRETNGEYKSFFPFVKLAGTSGGVFIHILEGKNVFFLLIFFFSRKMRSNKINE